MIIDIYHKEMFLFCFIEKPFIISIKVFQCKLKRTIYGILHTIQPCEIIKVIHISTFTDTKIKAFFIFSSKVLNNSNNITDIINIWIHHLFGQ